MTERNSGGDATPAPEEGRFRSFLRHVRMAIAMALAERSHRCPGRTYVRKMVVMEEHYAPRGQTMASAKEEVHEPHDATHLAPVTGLDVTADSLTPLL